MKHYIGIDVSKRQLDVDWLGEARVVLNQSEPIAALVEDLLASSGMGIDSGLLQESDLFSTHLKTRAF